MKKHIITAALIILSAGVSQAFDPHYYHSGEYVESIGNGLNEITTTGTATEQIESSPSPSIVSMDGKISEVPVKAITVEAMISDDIQTYNIPISYGFPLSLTGNKELLNLKLNLPFTKREFEDLEDSGLGDISFTANYLIRFTQLLMDSKLVIKAPTGEVEDADVPLGTGSTDVALYFNGTWYFEKYALKAGIGYAYNGNYDLMGTDIYHGDEYLLSAGGDYNINETMKAGALLSYSNRAEDEFKNPGGSSYAPGIITLDLTPSFTYLWKTYNAEFNASVSIPVYDSWNSDKGNDYSYDPDRSVKFNIGVSKPF